ncbi:glycine--tRNA ligase [Mycoplasma testudineum]|nr:glycine--tRNA ligase [Mycoplasma testudineum]
MTLLTNHLKESGFVFQGSEIYGGLSNTWDYGPYGTILKDKISNFWKSYFIKNRKNSYLIDSKILMNPLVWKSSGHLSNFTDLLIENKLTQKRYRADHLLEAFYSESEVAKFTQEQMLDLIKKHYPNIENKKTEWSEIRKFNLMFETYQGVIEGKKDTIYLRPETAQGIFINFKNVQRTMRAHLPLAIGQIGKSFRNEVTPGNFIFRTREFEQMELEVFVDPEKSMEAFDEYVNASYEFVLSLGIEKENIRIRKHSDEELSHYSKATSDIEFLFPWGWGELMGIAHRGDYDLSQHELGSKVNLQYQDPFTNKKYIPHVIEPSVGLDRLMLAILCQSFEIDEMNDNRILLDLPVQLSIHDVAILPLVKKQLDEAEIIESKLKQLGLSTILDSSGSIGKRYRRYDSLGIKYCLTIDYDSSSEQTFTLRDSKTMEQKRLSLEQIINLIQ